MTPIPSRIALYLHRIILCFIIGEMLFFAAIFAPRVFSVLERSAAAELQASIFPSYFLVGLVGSFGLLTIRALEIKRLRTLFLPAPALNWMIPLITLFIFAFSYSYLTPAITAETRAAIAAGLPRTTTALHTWSVRLNGTALMLLLVYLGRREPRL